MSRYQTIEVRGFKWPHRPTGIAMASFLGEDTFGCWLGLSKGEPWWSADRSRSGVFEESFVKLVPNGSFWSTCFNLADPIVDVDIIQPVSWSGNVLEEVDLELDILRSGDGRVYVRDRDEFERVRERWAMPNDISAQAEDTCARVRTLVEQEVEPFGAVGRAWLSRFLTQLHQDAP